MTRTTSFSLRQSAVLLAALVFSLGLWGSSAQAVPITTEKDSANFNYLYDGADLPNLSGWNIADRTPQGSVVNTTQMQYDPGGPADSDRGHYGWTDSALTHANGWTVEVNYQITDAGSALFGVWGMLIGDGSPGGTSDYAIVDFHGDAVELDEVEIASGDFTDGLHTMRIAQPAGGGNGDMHMWVDGTLVADNLSGQDIAGLQRMWLGNRSNQDSGQAVVDYVRIDNTGGFAPVAPAPVPEPNTCAMLMLGAIWLLRIRRRR